MWDEGRTGPSPRRLLPAGRDWNVMLSQIWKDGTEKGRFVELTLLVHTSYRPVSWKLSSRSTPG